MPANPRLRDDAGIVHDLQVQARLARDAAVERMDCKTFIVGGAFATGLILPPAFVAEHCSMSGVLAKMGGGTCTVKLHAHQGDTWGQTFDLDNTWKSWWEQPWAETLQAGDPFWIEVTAASVAGDAAGVAHDLAFGVVFGGESQNNGGNAMPGGGIS